MTAINYRTYQKDPVPENATVFVSGQVTDLNGNDLPGAQVTTLEATMIASETDTVIGLWDELDIKNDNGGVLNSDGSFTLTVPAADIVVPAGALGGRLVLLFKWTWGTGNIGRHRFSFPVADLERAP